MSHNIGSDVALLNGLMHIIIKEGWEASEYIKTRTENFERLKEVLEKYTPERVSEITGIDKAILRSAAEIYAKSKKSMILYAMGITQHVAGTDNVKVLCQPCHANWSCWISINGCKSTKGPI